MDSVTVPLTIAIKHGFLTAAVAGFAKHRAETTFGAFTLPTTWVSQMSGICEKTVRLAIAELTEAGYLVHVGGGGATGKPKQYKFDASTVVCHTTVKGGVYIRDFKGWYAIPRYSAVEVRLELLGWDLTEEDADMVMESYPTPWIAAKLDDCRERRKSRKNPSGYLKAALASIEIESERTRVIRRLKAEAAAQRKAADRELSATVAQRAGWLQGRARAAAEVQALAWWRGLTEAEQVAVEAAYQAAYPLAVGGGLWGFRPEDSHLSANWLLEHWGKAAQVVAGDRFIGVDVQADGRLFWLLVQAGPAGPVLADWGITQEAATVPAASAAGMLVDEGDGNRTAWVRAWVAELRRQGIEAASWKGGDHASGADLVAIGDGTGTGFHANERHWAGVALKLLNSGKLSVAAKLLNHNQQELWTGLASRLDIETRATDDHPFDAFKLAMAAGAGRGI